MEINTNTATDADVALVQAFAGVVRKFDDRTQCAWNDSVNNWVVAAAVARGWAQRSSVTQVAWTQNGVDFLNAVR